MSTIASPREPSLSGRRIPLISTPTTSSRPSLDTPRSDSSPSRPPITSNPSNTSSTAGTTAQPKRNRAALREYYNLQKNTTTNNGPSSLSTASQAPSSPASSSIHSFADDNGYGYGEDGEASEMDKEGFNAEEYVRKVLEEKSLGEVLGIYRGVLADVRALDAERKALVYDNYSKLIVATEMIGRMREGVRVGEGGTAGIGGLVGPGGKVGGIGSGSFKGPGTGPGKGGIGGGKGEGVEGVEELVERVRRGVEALRKDAEGTKPSKEEIEKAEKRRRARAVAERVLGTPDKVRGLVKEGKVDEARILWEKEKRLLERWRERGVGGPDVGECIEDGDRALRGEQVVGGREESNT
ncbi:Vps51/Vps67-domain-containing protein [Cadophora sp. MPI-SDFR-AT-0126]|nr:Vps51/Vps67-domain-containing protein [Leotiomycetes sp. MPI-SDFR-AT-0126]